MSSVYTITPQPSYDIHIVPLFSEVARLDVLPLDDEVSFLAHVEESNEEAFFDLLKLHKAHILDLKDEDGKSIDIKRHYKNSYIINKQQHTVVLESKYSNMLNMIASYELARKGKSASNVNIDNAKRTIVSKMINSDYSELLGTKPDL